MGLGKRDCREIFQTGAACASYLDGTFGFAGVGIIEPEWKNDHIGILFFGFAVDQLYGIEF